MTLDRRSHKSIGEVAALPALKGADIVMPEIAIPLLIVLNAGPSLHWGSIEASILAPLLWSAGVGAFVVLAGWRRRNKGFFASALSATFAAAIINMPSYFIGWWLVTLPHDCAWLAALFGEAMARSACGG